MDEGGVGRVFIRGLGLLVELLQGPIPPFASQRQSSLSLSLELSQAPHRGGVTLAGPAQLSGQWACALRSSPHSQWELCPGNSQVQVTEQNKECYLWFFKPPPQIEQSESGTGPIRSGVGYLFHKTCLDEAFKSIEYKPLKEFAIPQFLQ